MPRMVKVLAALVDQGNQIVVGQIGIEHHIADRRRAFERQRGIDAGIAEKQVQRASELFGRGTRLQRIDADRRRLRGIQFGVGHQCRVVRFRTRRFRLQLRGLSGVQQIRQDLRHGGRIREILFDLAVEEIKSPFRRGFGQVLRLRVGFRRIERRLFFIKRLHESRRRRNSANCTRFRRSRSCPRRWFRPRFGWTPRRLPPPRFSPPSPPLPPCVRKALSPRFSWASILALPRNLPIPRPYSGIRSSSERSMTMSPGPLDDKVVLVKSGNSMGGGSNANCSNRESIRFAINSLRSLPAIVRSGPKPVR